jgi:hypothetical protein
MFGDRRWEELVRLLTIQEFLRKGRCIETRIFTLRHLLVQTIILLVKVADVLLQRVHIPQQEEE